MPEAGMRPNFDESAAIRRTRELLIQRMDETGIKRHAIAKGTGLSEAVISQFLNDKYTGNNVSVAKNIQDWLERQSTQDSGPGKAQYVETAVSKQIKIGLNAAIAASPGDGRIALIYGPAGIGKTFTLQACREMYPTSIYIRIRTGSTSQMGFLKLFASSLGYPGSNCASRHFEEVVHVLKNSGRLIMIDEAHKLADSALEAVRDIHDETYCPIALIGTDEINRRMHEGLRVERRQFADQLNSRICIRRDLTRVMNSRGHGGRRLFTTEEIREMFAREQIRLAPESTRYLADLASTSGYGGLRAVRSILSMLKGKYESELVDIAIIKQAGDIIFDGRLPAIEIETEGQGRAAAAG